MTKKKELTTEELAKAMVGAMKKTMNNPSITRCCVEVRDAKTGEVLSDPAEHAKNYKPFEGHLADELEDFLEPT